MRTLFASAAVLLGALTSACGVSEQTPDISARPRGTYVMTEPDPEPRARLTAGEPLVLYLNRDGGTYTPGRNDARTNRSSLVPREVTVPPWDVPDDGWRQVVTCVRAQFVRWNVTVTDVDPGDAPHLESVIAGDPTDIGQQTGVGGVSPFATNCSTIDNSIVFTFAEVFGRDYRIVCEVAAQEMAHSFGLDHERLCEDPMTYMTDCGDKSFQDRDAPCGELEDRTCACGAATQNSVEILTERLGLASSGPVDPGSDGGTGGGPGGGGDGGTGEPADPGSGDVSGGCAAGGGGSGAAVLVVTAGLVVGARRRRRA